MMNGVLTVPISDAEVSKLLAIEEGHFADLKAIETLPAGLTRAVAALSNAEGGELFIGIDENRTTKKRKWRGFANQEAANAHIQVFEHLFPLRTDYKYEFLTNEQQSGLILKIQIAKTRDIKKRQMEKSMFGGVRRIFPSKMPPELKPYDVTRA
jgi:ATP-dependent DNA helicase RecG